MKPKTKHIHTHTHNSPLLLRSRPGFDTIGKVPASYALCKEKCFLIFFLEKFKVSIFYIWLAFILDSWNKNSLRRCSVCEHTWSLRTPDIITSCWEWMDAALLCHPLLFTKLVVFTMSLSLHTAESTANPKIGWKLLTYACNFQIQLRL